MKKLLALVLTLSLALSLAACGGEPVTLVSQIANGIAIDVPSDFGEFQEQSGGLLATNADKTGVITISAPIEGDGVVFAEMDQEAYLQQILGGPEGVEFVSYDNAADCNGTPAIFANFKMKNSNGVNVISNSYLLLYENGSCQSVMLNYTDGSKSSVATNVDAISKSIKPE